MRILFVSSANSRWGISPITKNQAESLMKYDPSLTIDFFPVKGKGIISYLKSARELRNYLRKNKYDIIHAHYSLSGYVSVLSMTRIPKIVSVMGSDAYLGFPFSFINRLMAKWFWSHIIAKSKNIVDMIGEYPNLSIIPNGVDPVLFSPMDKLEARQKLGLDPEKFYVLFAADPSKEVKNFPLAESAFKKADIQGSELLPVFNVMNKVMPLYFNAADVLLFTSFREGSPNVIKEACACNCPIVSTNVGDVSQVIENIEGCYISSFDTEEAAKQLKKAVDFAGKQGRTNGYEKIKHLHSDVIAEKILNIYKSILDKRK